MLDGMKTCHHTLSEDVVFKEVVVIGNGPSGMVTSFMLAGNVPHLKEVPADLPIDDMLKARLSNIPPGQNLYEVDLMKLAEGLEGRSTNPIPLLMDNLLRPCADLGLQADSLVEWNYDVDKEVDHVVLGREPPGGAWHAFPARVRTLSPASWLSLPPHAALPAPRPGRVPARAVAAYCRRYVRLCRLQRFFRSGVVVSSVSRARPPHPACPSRSCPLNARFCVCGYEKATGAAFRYWCRDVVVACGGGDRVNTLPSVDSLAVHDLQRVDAAISAAAQHFEEPSILVVGSGVSAADAVLLARRAGLLVYHAHRAPAEALARLTPDLYPDYCQVLKMMCDGPEGGHLNYAPLPDHTIVDVSPLPHTHVQCDSVDNSAISRKRVKLLNLFTNETKEITVLIIAVLIGSKPDLHFLQSNFDVNYAEDPEANVCDTCKESKHPNKRKITDGEPKCFLRHHWHYLKGVIGQSIQSCKSRYLNYTEINGNSDKEECHLADCRKKDNNDNQCTCDEGKVEIVAKTDDDDSKDNPSLDDKCKCQQTNPYSEGIGFAIDEKKPVDCRWNPIAIDKSTHEMLNAPSGMYALGPVTADNFIRFIPGGALALVSQIHKLRKADI